MKPLAPHLLVVLLFLLNCSPLSARVPGGDVADSVRITHGTDSAARGVDTLRRISRPRKSPGLAMLFSAVIPGAGQFYNQSYWKVPVVFGLGLYFVSTWLDQNRRTQIYRQKYAADLVANPPDLFTSDVDLREREFYKEQRDTFAWYFVILYFVNIADAYVDASLFDFDVGPDLTLRFLPGSAGPLNPVPGFSLQIRF